MSERWIKESERMFKLMKEQASKKERDRLEVINSILISINALERSAIGWRSWIRDLSIMSKFSLEEMKGIDATLRKQAETVIEYDIESTKRLKNKLPRMRIPRQRRTRDRKQGIYV